MRLTWTFKEAISLRKYNIESGQNEMIEHDVLTRKLDENELFF